MTQNIKTKKMPKTLFFMTALALSASYSYADDLSGTWKFEQADEYFGLTKKVPAPDAPLVQIVNGKVATSYKCFDQIKKRRYNFSEPFQSFMKDGGTEKSLITYLKTKFSFALSPDKYYRSNDLDKDCLSPFADIFLSENKLITVSGGSFFYSYTRTKGGTDQPISPNVQLYGYKISQLPFLVSNFVNLCESAIPHVNGLPQSTEVCAPVYYPYTATKNDNNPLAQLIGSHTYLKGRARHADGYDNPASMNLHPTFMILPPMNDVLLVRVSDLDDTKRGRSDRMAGVYLAIKNGKVTDQQNDGCDMNTDYVCVDENGTKLYQLLDTGKFKALN